LARYCGWKCNAEQSPLTAAANFAPDVQKRLVHQLAAGDDPDSSGLLDDEKSLITDRRGEVNRLVQTLGNDLGREGDRLASSQRLSRRRRSVVARRSAHHRCERENERRRARHVQAFSSFFGR